MSVLPDYSECAHTKRFQPVTVSQEDIEDACKDTRVLPLFEKTYYENMHRKHYSLENNEYLRCRWHSYVKHFEERVFTPFDFVDIRHFHYYNCATRLLASESFHTKTDFRFKLKIGPGVDFRGQMPIPHDMFMKRGTSKPKAQPKAKGKEKKKEKIENKDGGKKSEENKKVEFVCCCDCKQ